MKWLRLALAVLSLSGSTYAQGTIIFNNQGPNNGRVFFQAPEDLRPLPAPLNRDLNFSLLVHRPGPILETVQTWLLSDGTAVGINVGPGLFADPAHNVIVVSDISPGQNIVVSIAAWLGNYPTLAAAKAAGVPFGESSSFAMVAGTMEAPPALVGMQDFTVAIPEPRILSLAIIGLAIFMVRSTIFTTAGFTC